MHFLVCDYSTLLGGLLIQSQIRRRKWRKYVVLKLLLLPVVCFLVKRDCVAILIRYSHSKLTDISLSFVKVEEKLESGQGKTPFRRLFSRFCTPIFLEVYFYGEHWWLLTVLFTAKTISIPEETLLLLVNCLTIWLLTLFVCFLQSFILTFLAEWGDRSQIATIAVRKKSISSLISNSLQYLNQSMIFFP